MDSMDIHSTRADLLLDAVENASLGLDNSSVGEKLDVFAPSLVYLPLKRTLDVVISLVLLVVLTPVFLMLIVIIRRDGGPAFFAHTRLGAQAQAFGCLKFRSMRPNSEDLLRSVLASDLKAHADWQRYRKIRNDPRITRIGKLMRALSLDELPQLLNVLRGDMSLVGPRPITFSELQEHYEPLGGSAAYLAVRPGITGLWQVSGRSNTSYAMRVSLDVEYYRAKSTGLDLLILIRTVPAVLLRQGAC
jgi:exopolysaccharide production protein ExoY